MYGQGVVKVPLELLNAPQRVLEEYVRNRLRQFGGILSQRLLHLAPGLHPELLDRATSEALQQTPAPEYGSVPLDFKELQLVFRHDCMAQGCLDPQCALCQYNPNRRCHVNFDRKYLVNDLLKAKCAANIRVELIDRNTAQVFDDDIPDLKVEIFILDGNLYDAKFLGPDGGKLSDGGNEPPDELEQCALLLNKKKNTPLLACGSGGCNDAQGRVVLPVLRGKVILPDLHVTDSSEAILSGRKPPFRLLVRAVLDGRPHRIRHAISEPFVVATRRTRTAGKVDIPSVEDHVSKLEHMGKETVKKLQDIRTAALQAGVEIEIPENCVQKVGEFKQLAMRAELDGHLRQKLQHVLKLSKEKWDEARDHAIKAVVADNRMRAWYQDGRHMEVGLLFACRLGAVDLDRPVALLQRKIENGEPTVEATLMANLSPSQRQTVGLLTPEAAHSWWVKNHPGWAIFPMDSDTYLQSGALVPAQELPDAIPTTTSVAAPSAMSGRSTSPLMHSSDGMPLAKVAKAQPPSPGTIGPGPMHHRSPPGPGGMGPPPGPGPGAMRGAMGPPPRHMMPPHGQGPHGHPGHHPQLPHAYPTNMPPPMAPQHGGLSPPHAHGGHGVPMSQGHRASSMMPPPQPHMMHGGGPMDPRARHSPFHVNEPRSPPLPSSHMQGPPGPPGPGPSHHGVPNHRVQGPPMPGPHGPPPPQMQQRGPSPQHGMQGPPMPLPPQGMQAPPQMSQGHRTSSLGGAPPQQQAQQQQLSHSGPASPHPSPHSAASPECSSSPQQPPSKHQHLMGPPPPLPPTGMPSGRDALQPPPQLQPPLDNAPNPFVSVQTQLNQNRNSQVASIVHELKEAGTLDLSAIPSIPISNTIFQAGGHQAVVNNSSLNKLQLPSLSMGSAFGMLSDELDFVLPDNMETSLVNLSLPTNLKFDGLSGLHSLHQGIKHEPEALQPTGSGLDSMQSIEQALPDVEKAYREQQQQQQLASRGHQF